MNLNFILFYFIQGNPIFWKAYIVGSGEQVKLRLSQALIKDARPDSNSRSAVQISSPLPYATPLGDCKLKV